MYLLIASVVLAVWLVSPEYVREGGHPGHVPKLLVHGNYCGLGNNAPLPPIDAVDAACARHDACTPAFGLPTQDCNFQLRRSAGLIAHDTKQSDELRAIAGFIAAGASLLPFDQSASIAPVVLATADLYGWVHADRIGPLISRDSNSAEAGRTSNMP
jgi:hypothetical protein